MTDNTVQTVADARFAGYSRTAKRLHHGMKAAESHLVVRAQAMGMPAARLLVRVGFFAAVLALLLGVLLVAFWIFIAVAPALIFALIIYARAAIGLEDHTHGGSAPDTMGADLYAGDRDRNGHYIGHLKTTWLDE